MTAIVKPQKAAVYCRLAWGDETRLNYQEFICKRFAAELGWEVAEVYSDAGASAGDGSPTRPAYERLLADLRNGDRDGIVVHDISRLSRSSRDLRVNVATHRRGGGSS